ncbi:MAG: hypothetical protein ABIB04_01835 [Patescibacteria group bacterium]
MPANVSITPDAPKKQASPVDKTKKHSKIFVEYYASIFLFLIAAYIGLAFFILIPIIQNIRKTNAEIENQIGLIQQERAYLSALEQSVAAAEAIPEVTLDRVDEALPYEAKFPSLIRQFGYASEKNNVRIDSLNILEAKVAPVVQAGRVATSTEMILPVDINISLRAMNYFDVKRFLADIETNMRLMDVIGLSSSFNGAEFNYTIQMRTYLFAGTAKAL